MSWEPIDPDNPDNSALIGDDPFDLFGQAIREISECYQRDLGRKPSTFELAKTMERVLETHFGQAVAEGPDRTFVALSIKTRKRRKRQQCVVGDFLNAKAANGKLVYARVFEIHPGCGHLIGVYDSIGLEKPRLEDLRVRRLIVKVTPIHYQYLENWLSAKVADLELLATRGWGIA
jgi:hypothetical protein